MIAMTDVHENSTEQLFICCIWQSSRVSSLRDVPENVISMAAAPPPAHITYALPTQSVSHQPWIPPPGKYNSFPIR